MLFLYNIMINIIAFFAYILNKGKIYSDPQWKGRFAKFEKFKDIDLWIHAASVGEVKVIGHLIEYLHKINPSIKIHITTMTRSGYKTAFQLYVNQKISISQFPFDTKKLVQKTFDLIQPKVLVIAETEIWPNLILEADNRKIPIILINGRMSEKAFKQYSIFQKSFAMLLEKYTKLFLKSENDNNRYSNFVQADKRTIVGDMKFDAPIIERTQDKIEGIRLACGIEKDSFVFVAGSTRPGEEELLADLFLKIYENYKTFNLIIAPRHIERINEIIDIFSQKGIRFKLYGTSSKHDSVILVDKVGLLENLYLAADLAFVGGTMTPLGGHNLLEPVWAGVPVVFGNSVFNVQESADYILQNNYGTQINTLDELYTLVEKNIQNEISFKKKTTNDLQNSATSKIGEYLLKMI